MLDFPSSPASGQIFDQWRWDGVKWVALVGDAPPGPAGPTGPTGATGPQGPTGATGPAGVVSASPPLALSSGNLTVDLSAYAPLASPVFTGDARAVTPATADNDTSIATTAFVKAQSYLTANQTITLSGDISGSGATAITATLATVNANVGTFAVTTVNAKGLVTAAGNLTGDVTTSGAAATLATVNGNVGTFQGLTVNAKGLVTAAANQSYLTSPVNLTSQVTGTLPLANGGTGQTTAAAAPWVETIGDTMSGRLAISFADPNPATTHQLLIAGTTKGVRVFTDSAKTNIEGVDQTGTGPYQPLAIGGSMVQITASNTERARVDSSGISTSGSMTIAGSSGNAALFMNGGRNWYQLVDVTAANGVFSIVDATAGAYRLTIDQTGGCKNTTGTWSAISDERLKRDVIEYKAGLAEIIQLCPVTFKYNGIVMPDDGVQQYGLVAQQVQPIMPEIVSTWSHKPPDDPEAKATEFLTVDPGRLIYACINAIKDLSAQVEALEADIARLRRRH